jgi:hypothetical protein
MREGLIQLNSPDVNPIVYFGDNTKQIFWRESESIIIALVGT